MEKFAKRTRLIDYGLFAFYNKKKTISKKNKVTNISEFNIIAKTIWKVVARNLVEKEAGVVLDKFGYLCHWMNPKKKVFKAPRKGKVKLMTNYHTGSHFYNSTLFTNIFKRDFFKGWSLDKSFNKQVKLGRHKKLKSGFKYKLRYSLVKRIYTDRFLNKLDNIS